MKRLLLIAIIVAMTLTLASGSVIAEPVSFEDGCGDANAGNDLDETDGDNTKITEGTSDTSVCVDGQSEQGDR